MLRRIFCIVLLTSATALAQSVTDSSLKVQRWVRGLQDPTGMAFIDDAGTALVLEKSTGKVQILQNKTITGTALDLPVNHDSERGLLGVAISPTFSTDKFVYLYYTRATTTDNSEPIDNRVERYRWTGSQLTLDRTIIHLPVTPGPNHNGGKIAFGPDGKLYAAIGELNRNERTSNFENSTTTSRAGVILRINPSGKSVPTNPFYSASNIGTSNAPLNDIFAYGVRNSYGIAFDPVRGNLWDTENGPASYDEINRIRPGFNSGWQDIMGPTSRNGGTTGTLVNLGDRAYYSDPRFSWVTPVAPTDALFMPSARLGGKFKNDLFVATLHGGAILDFNLSGTRKSLVLDGPLADTIADNSDNSLFAEQSSILLGQDFGVITDLVAGPGGIYVLSFDKGVMYRITTNDAITQGLAQFAAFETTGSLPDPAAWSPLVTMLLLLRRRHSSST